MFREYEICLVRPKGLKRLFVLHGALWLVPATLILFLCGTLVFLWPYYRDYSALRQKMASLQAAEALQLDRALFLLREAGRYDAEARRMWSFNTKLAAMAGLTDKSEPGAGAAGRPGGLRLDPLALYRPSSMVRRLFPNYHATHRDILAIETWQQELVLALRDRRAHLAAMPSIWPIDGEFSSGFGWRHGSFHKGVDLTAPSGTPVMASADGKVVFVGYDGGYGLKIIVEHKFGMATAYAHLRRSEVSEGQTVSRGEVIAQSGSSGRTTGPHLHYEVTRAGVLQDPSDYMLD